MGLPSFVLKGSKERAAGAERCAEEMCGEQGVAVTLEPFYFISGWPVKKKKYKKNPKNI